MYKACSRCGRIHDFNHKCRVGVEYKTKEDRELRNTNEWHKKSLEIREAAHWLCEVCKDEGRLNYNDLEVHHIEKLTDHPELLLENSNLICLCVYHHKLADDGEIDKSYLKNLAAGRGV